MHGAATFVVLRVMHSAHPARLAFRLLCLATFVRSEPPPPPPSSKPPPPSPPPPSAPGSVVVLRLVARGFMSDYPDTSELQRRIAIAGNLWPSNVAISVIDRDRPGAGQVWITATLTWDLVGTENWHQKPTTRAEVRRSLKSNIGTAASASAWLGITVKWLIMVGFACDGWGGESDGDDDDDDDDDSDDSCAVSKTVTQLPWLTVGGLGLLICLCVTACATMTKARQTRASSTESAAAARAAAAQPQPLSIYPQPQPQQMQMGAVPVCTPVVQGYLAPVQQQQPGGVVAGYSGQSAAQPEVQMGQAIV